MWKLLISLRGTEVLAWMFWVDRIVSMRNNCREAVPVVETLLPPRFMPPNNILSTISAGWIASIDSITYHERCIGVRSYSEDVVAIETPSYRFWIVPRIWEEFSYAMSHRRIYHKDGVINSVETLTQCEISGFDQRGVRLILRYLKSWFIWFPMLSVWSGLGSRIYSLTSTPNITSFFILPAQSHQHIFHYFHRLLFTAIWYCFFHSYVHEFTLIIPIFTSFKDICKLNDTLSLFVQSQHAFPPRLQQHHDSTIQCSTFTHPTSQRTIIWAFLHDTDRKSLFHLAIAILTFSFPFPKTFLSSINNSHWQSLFTQNST